MVVPPFSPYADRKHTQLFHADDACILQYLFGAPVSIALGASTFADSVITQAQSGLTTIRQRNQLALRTLHQLHQKNRG
jgi:type III secretion system FlhB-like substrate exporter